MWGPHLRIVAAGLAIALLGLGLPLGATAATTTSCRPAYRAAGWVAAENSNSGTNEWRIPSTNNSGAIQGYLNRVSVKCGAQVKLYVSTSAIQFRVVVYRMGYYGGTGARETWRSPLLTGLQQAKPLPTSSTNMVETHWKPSATITVARSWPPGDYLFKLVSDDGTKQSYVPLTVTDPNSHAALALMNDVTTWQAYNDWGGYSLYHGPGGFADRSRVVSYDRPYYSSSPSAQGDGHFLLYDYPLVSFVEQQGLDVTYITDIDLHRNPSLVLNHAALVSMSHDEYWSPEMRDGVENGVANGVNMAFFGANAMYWVTRFQDSPLGPYREQIVYKSATEDPETDSSHVTVQFRQSPVNDPESQIVGEQSDCSQANGDMQIENASHWIFDGTGLVNGDVLPHMVGYESDRIGAYPHPPNVQALSNSSFICGSQGNKPWTSNMSYYSSVSGAGVFSTGTITWICVLTASCTQISGNSVNQPQIRTITGNVLSRFASGPAG
jgi:N,N-dimethylformamidase beta subunit-like, C-terminal